jgi:hypothetical protein
VAGITIAKSIAWERRIWRPVEFGGFVDYKSDCSSRSTIVLNCLQPDFVICSNDRWGHRKALLVTLKRPLERCHPWVSHLCPDVFQIGQIQGVRSPQYPRIYLLDLPLYACGPRETGRVRHPAWHRVADDQGRDFTPTRRAAAMPYDLFISYSRRDNQQGRVTPMSPETSTTSRNCSSAPTGWPRPSR